MQRATACGVAVGDVFVEADMPISPIELLQVVSEPTRLRIVNALAGAPLFVSDLQAILDLPQSTVSRHLAVMREQEIVHDTPVAQFVLYRIGRVNGPAGRLLDEILEAMRHDPSCRTERDRAVTRSRTHTRTRLSAG
ncbi:MAG: metalloregulator ArsR/SmtB family transcription factor [Gemmatimonadales bacterium]|nr:metalloregulator ArsR/SmtB family transcription factor [Gemmatimonadales bacterium]MDZ4259632.1 metalloregulator ArsR/SmtB family transcription factor [Gemmatimonadales bacterium]MDZ4391206.1 metalloregulator ArsR/SmtB family transcription factor [Gemmatimonadales bacterium]